MARAWNKEEKDFILENYEELGAQGCSKHLNRTAGAITNYVYRHKLPVAYKPNSDNNGKIKKAKEAHKNLVQSLGFVLEEEYQGSQVKIKHKHTCGFTWLVSPNNFRKTKGCPNCRQTISDEIVYVYICHFPKLNLNKVGITNCWETRKYDFGEEVELLHIWGMADRMTAQKLERYLLDMNKNNLENTGILKNGNTETFYASGV